jgi:hypothetical protein
MWREVERALTAAAPGSPEFERLAAEAMQLRDDYQHLVREALARDRPVPAAWPEAGEADA